MMMWSVGCAVALWAVVEGGRSLTCSNLKAPRSISATEMKSLAAKVFDAAAPFTLGPSDVETARKGARSSRLFTYLNKNAPALQHSTFKAFKAIKDDFDPEMGRGHDEEVGSAEARRIDAFWDAVCQTPAIAVVKAFLESKGVWRGRVCQEIRYIWASFFSRSRGQSKNDGSGFEHAFLGDVEDGKVGGGHFWYAQELQEEAGQFRYSHKIRSGQANVLVSYDLFGGRKPVGSAWVGQPIEQDIALGTVCAIFFPARACPVGKYKGCETEVTTYPIAKFRDSQKRCFISSSFPAIPRSVSCSNRL